MESRFWPLRLSLPVSLGWCTVVSATTKSTHQAKLGPIELSVKDKQTVNVPVWAGVGGIVVGGALLLFSRKKN